MAERLREIFNPSLVRAIASELRCAHPRFAHRAFSECCIARLDGLELTQRAWLIADAMYGHLPRDFPTAAELIISSLGPELERSGEFGLAPLRYMPHVFIVQKYGGHARPRLPWAPRLRAFQENPRPVIALLELLKDDAERYVQRSVANNLNDISKDNPNLAVDVCRRWIVGAPSGRTWIVRHALRSLVKSAHRGALATVGAGKKPQVKIGKARLSASSIRLGGAVRFELEIENRGKSNASLLVDYRVHFVKANGKTRAKVFKLRRFVLQVGARATLADSISFRSMTTRRHYPGRHHIDILINGVAHPCGKMSIMRHAEHF